MKSISPEGHDRRAKYLGKLPDGTRVYRCHVVVNLNDSRQCATVARVEHSILASSAAQAANLIRDEYRYRPETEIYSWGPRGGVVHRYVGWHSAIVAELED